MSIGPFLFGAPWALLGLVSLPIIWLVLRATPPSPKEAELPSLKLLDELELREETPARTPWWLLLLRFLAALAAIVGLSLPVFAPGATTSSPSSPSGGPVLVVIDNGWTSGERWIDLRNTASSVLDGEARDTPGHILLTAPQALNTDPAEPLLRTDFDARIRSLTPYPWPVDRADALERLNSSGLRPARIVWLSDGLDPDSAEPFAQGLAALAPLSIFTAPPRGPLAITGLSADAEGATLTVYRTETGLPANVFVSGLTEAGAALATAEAIFDANEAEATAQFDLPPAALSRLARFRVTGSTSAGTVWLWDSDDRSRRVGLVSSDTTAQPLLSDMHYIRKALEPFATIREAELSDLIEADPDAIIVTDIGQIAPEAQSSMIDWIEGGGALVRFAGPRMAAQQDSLVPAPLRRASRAIGGALTWEEPQPLGAFPLSSPFAGLSPPDDIKVRQQVLARPGPELARRTWARLADGSPLVTADKRGDGMLILFHVTAGPDWSDLPYSGVFVDMLRRSIAAGQGEAVADENGLYTPTLALDSFGQLRQPSSAAIPLAARDFAQATPSEQHPPGLYQGPAGTRALNLGALEMPKLVTSWPASATLMGDAEAETLRLAGPLLGVAALLFALDVLIALGVAGRLPRRRRSGLTGLVLVITTLGLTSPPSSMAQTETKAIEAALDMRLAYIQTGDTATDRTTKAGLNGLSLVLYNRSSVEPAEAHAVNLETDALEVYPILFLALPDTPQPFSELAVSRLNTYLRAGGALFIDTRRGGTLGTTDSFDDLSTVLAGLDTPTLSPASSEHVLTRSFYLLEGFPGRYSGRRLWIEATGSLDRGKRRGDGVSRIFVGDADYLAAWAIDDRRRPLFSVDGGDTQREMAKRFGVNLIIYVLTGNYKEDQVHIPALLERLNEDDAPQEPGLDDERGVIP